MATREDQIRRLVAEGLSDDEIVRRLRGGGGPLGGVRSFVRGLPGYDTARRLAGWVTDAATNPAGLYEQAATGFGSLVMRVPEGALRMYGADDAADKIGAERQRREAEVGPPDRAGEGTARFLGTLAPYAVAGVAAGPNLLTGLAADMALDVPVAASSRDASLAGMAADMTDPMRKVPTERRAPFEDPGQEQAFWEFYDRHAKRWDLHPDPDASPYDYRKAFEAGAEPDAEGHWPSEFKLRDHPNLIVDGRVTATGEPAEGGLAHRALEGIARRPALRGLAEGAAGLGLGAGIAKGLPAGYRGLRRMGEEGHVIGGAADDLPARSQDIDTGPVADAIDTALTTDTPEPERPAAPIGAGGQMVDDLSARRVGMPRDLQDDLNLLAEEKAHTQAVRTPGSRVVLDNGVVGEVVRPTERFPTGERVLVRHEMDGATVERWYSPLKVSVADEAGAVHPALLGPLVGAAGGATAGAATADEGESRVLRGFAGAAIGAGVGLAGYTAASRAGDLGGVLRREFTVEGDLPSSVFRGKVTKDSWLSSQESGMRFSMRDFDRAVSSEYGKLDDAGLAHVDDVLKGQADASTLGPKTRDAVVRMRNEIDAMSRHMVDSGLVEGEMAATIDKNMGVYTTRSYRVFDDPEWAQKVAPEVRNKAKALLRSEYPTLQDAEVEGLIERLLYKAEDAPMRVIRGGRLGAKDLSTLQRRKEIAPEIRALWGEYRDPRVNYARSVTKMAHAVGNHQFLTEVRANGVGQFLFEQPIVKNGLEFKAQLAAEGSEVMAPLNGLYTTPEIKRAFDETFGAEGAPEWLQAYYKANAALKYGKTVGSLQTHVRNTVGNLGFAVANGHWRVNNLYNAVRAVDARLGRKTLTLGLVVENDEAWRTYYRSLQELGVVGESAYAGELRAALKDAGMKEGVEALLPNTNIFRKAVDGLTGLYRAEDDLWKVFAFENEKARYAAALGDSPEIDRLAADIVRNTYPTYSMIPKGVQRLRRFPVVGTFVSFPAEVLRVGKNTITQAAKELADPALRAIGAQRLVGILAAAAGVPSLAIASRHLTGVTKDEEDDLRLFLPSWSENSNLVQLGRTEDGKYRYVDLSYTDPYSYLRKPVMAFMRGEDWESALFDAVAEAAEPFASEEIGFQHIVDILRNTKAESGGAVYNPQAPADERALAIMGHLWDALEPGTVNSIQRIVDGIEGEVSLYGRSYDPKLEAMAVMTGHRITEFDVRQGVSYKMRELVEEVRDARSLLTSTIARSGSVSDDEIGGAQEDTQRSATEIFGELHAIASAAERMGMSRREVLTALNTAGLSQPDARTTYAGAVPEYTPGDQFFRNLEERVRASGGDPRTVQDRRRALRGYRPPTEVVAP